MSILFDWIIFLFIDIKQAVKFLANLGRFSAIAIFVHDQVDFDFVHEILFINIQFEFECRGFTG